MIYHAFLCLLIHSLFINFEINSYFIIYIRRKYYFITCFTILFSIVLIIMLWQYYFITGFPDVDTDAYIHHTIARQIILSPEDLSIHWVWLPLFHYLSAGAILIGANMDSIRISNMFIWAIMPFLLFYLTYKKNSDNSLFVAFVSSVLCALFPVGILMGTTAQPESLFALLLLLFIISVSKGKYILSSIILTFACMLRYEAWVIILISFILYLADLRKSKKVLSKKTLNFLLPGLAIIIWAFLREPFDGKLFGFLFQTQQFASDALQERNSFQGGIIKVVWDFIHYPIIIPFLFSGINLVFITFGIKRCAKENKWLLYSGLGILIFITLSWMMKSNLGLNRHFVALIPLYSVLTAYGMQNVIEHLNGSSLKSNFLKKINIRNSLLAAVFISCMIYLTMWLYIWSNNYESGYPEKKTTAEFLRNIPDSNTIFCNDAIVEIFSEIDYRRFNRTWLEDNTDASEIIFQTAKKENYVCVVIPDNKWKNIRGIGEILYQSPMEKNTNQRLLILKVTQK